MILAGNTILAAASPMKRTWLWIALLIGLGCGSSLTRAAESSDNGEATQRAVSRWIWAADDSNDADGLPQAVFRQSFDWSGEGPLTIRVAAADTYDLFLNGQAIGTGHGWESPTSHDLQPMANAGPNSLAILVSHESGRCYLWAAVDSGDKEPSITLTDSQWKAHIGEPNQWQEPDSDDSNWKSAVTVDELSDTERLQFIADGHRQPAPLVDLVRAWSTQPAAPEILAVCAVTRELAVGLPHENETLLRELTMALAACGEVVAIGQLHELFESHPERRALVAMALCRHAQQQRRRPEDWRVLVRALNVVEAEQARTVLQTLPLFAERATRPEWMRRVILLGLTLDETGKKEALRLLEHWTGQKLVQDEASPTAQLAAAQGWFRKQYPEAADPVLPVSSPDAHWSLDGLWKAVSSPNGSPGDWEGGRLAYAKAQCAKCHRFGPRGEKAGPDLTTIMGRLTRKELLEALLFPSERVSDQFQTTIVTTKDGRTLVGIVGVAPGNAMTILQPTGEKITLVRQDIEETTVSKLSAMPDNTLDKLTFQEVVDLFEYLRRPPDD